jgi:hypothetical protein
MGSAYSQNIGHKNNPIINAEVQQKFGDPPLQSQED